MPKKAKDPFKQSSFRPSIQVNFKQIIVIILILLAFASIPFVVDYISNPDKGSITDSISSTINNLKLQYEETDSPLILTIPLINVDINLTIFKQNPQLFSYIGLGLVFISIIIGITLIRNLRK